MWTDDDTSTAISYMKGKTRGNSLKMVNSNSFSTNQSPKRTKSLCHAIDPRFNQLLSRSSSKISPIRNDVNQQNMSNKLTEMSVPYQTYSSNVFPNSDNRLSNQENSVIASKSTKEKFTPIVTEKVRNRWHERHDQTKACLYFLICLLCLMLIIIPIALVFGLPKNNTITVTDTGALTMAATTLSPTTAQPIVSITRVGDPITGLYNTTAGGPTGGYNGMYSYPSETPPYAIDGLVSTKYLNYGGTGGPTAVVYQPGAGTGFYVTPTITNVSVACALLFATGNDAPERDPLTVTLEGTNVTATAALNLGSSWTLIYSGPTGLDPTIAPSRTTYGIQQNFSNTIPYSSYRLLVTSQRANSCCTQYSEVQIMGYI